MMALRWVDLPTCSCCGAVCFDVTMHGDAEPPLFGKCIACESRDTRDTFVDACTPRQLVLQLERAIEFDSWLHSLEGST